MSSALPQSRYFRFNLSPRAAIWWRQLATPGAILCFHGLTSLRHPAAGIAHLPAERFEELVRVVRRFAEVVPLSDLLDRHVAGKSTAGLIAITFDDAYASLQDAVADVIGRESIPVTIFVVSGHAERGDPYWWDRVDDLFPRVPEQRWRHFEAAIGVPDSYRIGQPRAFGPLRPLRQWMLAEHQGRLPPAIDIELGALEEEVGTRTVQRSMSWEELARLAECPFVEFGVHTASHPVLPLLSTEEAEAEILMAAEQLQRRTARYVPVLAAPFGLFDERTAGVARRAGMIATLALGNCTVRQSLGTDLVPRFGIGANETTWKLAVKACGMVENVRRLTGGGRLEMPALPSPTT